MAKYKAVTRIKWSDPTVPPEGGAVEVVTFEQGDVVTGLPKETMKDLWDAGALEKVEDEPKPVEEPPSPPPPPAS